MDQRRVVTLVLRANRPGGHSIERLFATLRPIISRSIEVKWLVVPHHRASGLSIIRNVIYVLRNREGPVHVTGDVQYIAGLLPGRRTILTIHDCAYVSRLRGLRRIVYRALWFHIPCWRASIVTVISSASKAALRDVVCKLADRAIVIPNCVPEGICKRARAWPAEKFVVLQIGSGNHKNLERLICAVKGLPCSLMIVGKISDMIMEKLIACKIEFVNEHDVSDLRMQEIYGECDILFFASLYEGFGLPILEGQKAGIPVVTSDRSSMPEVAGGGAALVDPESVGDIRDALIRLSTDSDYRTALVERGFQNVKRFTAEAVAQRYLEAYSSLFAWSTAGDGGR